MLRMPAVIVTSPLKVLAPESVRVPVPLLVRPPVPLITPANAAGLVVPAIVRVAAPNVTLP